MEAERQSLDGITRAEARRLALLPTIHPTTTPVCIPATSCTAPAAQEPLASATGHAAQGEPASGPNVPCETTPAAEAPLSLLGRPPEIVPTEAEARGLLSAYLKTNLKRQRGSMTTAARLFAHSEACSPALREAILREIGPERASKHQLPRTVKRAMQASPALVTYSRNPRDADVMLGHARGVLRKHWAEERRLFAGESMSFDDGSINFVVCVPWPWGGCACSNKYGVKVGRFQFLPACDGASDFIPGFTYAIRPTGAYRAEDVCGAMGRLWRDTVKPSRVVLERGTWESQRVTSLLAAAGVEVQRSYAPRQKLIENVFNRLWTILSATPGQVGRYRGEMERENKLLTAAQAGTIDPRDYFVSLQIAMAALENAVRFHNATPIESRQYGKWTPEIRWREDLAAHPRESLDSSLAYLWAPEVKTWKARRGCVGGPVATPQGITLPAPWWSPELLAADGRHVTVHFDPWEAGCPATLALTEDWPLMGWKAGRVLASAVTCLEDLPSIAAGAAASLAEAGEANAFERGRQMRASLRAVVLREYRAIAPDAKLARRESEVRGPSLTTTPAVSTAAPDSEHVPTATSGQDHRRGAISSAPARAARPDPTDDDLAALERLERRAQERGLIPAGYPPL